MRNDKNIAAVIKNPAAIRKIKNPSFDVCMAAVMQDGKSGAASRGLLLKYINPAPFTRREYFKLCHAAVKSNPMAVSMVKEERLATGMYERLMSAAVSEDGLSLRLIKKQTPELCLEAVEQNPKAISYVDKAMCEAVNPHCYAQLEEAARRPAKGKKSPKKNKIKETEKTKSKEPVIDLRTIKKQTDALCLKAVKQDGLQLRYVYRQTRKICREAIKQNQAANDYVRDDDMVWLDDLFGDFAEGMADFADLIVDYAFYCIQKKSYKIPPELKDIKNRQNKVKYYSACKKAVRENPCNIRHVKAELLFVPEWYTRLCLTAIKEFPQVIDYINKSKIESARYYEICCAVFDTEEKLNLIKCLKMIKGPLLSSGQYLSLIEKLIKADPENSEIFILRIIDAKALTNIHYYKLCRKLLAKSVFCFNHIIPELLSKAQYTELCYLAVKKSCQKIDDIDSQRLEKKDWLELCRMVIRKKGSFLYYLDMPSAKDRKEMLPLAIENGGGLKYLAKQNYSQCLDVIKKDPRELQHVRPEQFTNPEYFTLCETAVKKDGASICYIDDIIFNNSQYVYLCQKAITKFPGNIGWIAQERIPAALYRQWFTLALDYNPYWISASPLDKNYFDYCLEAVKKDRDGRLISEVKYLRLTPQQYKTLKKLSEKNKKEE